MPKVEVFVTGRAKEFQADGFYVSGKLLMCKFCNCRLDHKRKDTLIKHTESEKHIKGKARWSEPGTSTRQVTLEEHISTARQARESKEEFILNTTEAFVKANIPMEKFDDPAIREWMAMYVKGAGDLPSANRLRQHYVPLLGDKKRAEIKEDVKGQDIAILSDETTDKNGRCVFNILFRSLAASSEQKTHLAASVVLDAANGVNCARAINDTLNRYEIDFNNVIAAVSDSARYMVKCFATLEGLIGELKQVQCWAHKVNLVGDVWQDQLDDVNTAVIKVKHAFLNARKRKSEYLAFLAERYEGDDSQGNVTAFPIPVMTRWNTWFKSVIYISKHLDDLVVFFNQLDDGNAGIKYFKNATPASIQAIRTQAIFVSLNCPPLMDLITFLEGSKYATSHLLRGKLSDIEVKLTLLGNGTFNETINDELKKLPPLLKESTRALLRETAQKSLVKLKGLLNSDPSKELFQAIGALFDPRNSSKFATTADLISYKRVIPFLKQIDSQVFLEGYMVFQNAIKNELGKKDCNVNVVETLCGLKVSQNVFATAAIKAIWFPCSNVDAERSFSTYSLVVSDKRRKLTAENVETLTMVSFE